jgi:hypothetical protein
MELTGELFRNMLRNLAIQNDDLDEDEDDDDSEWDEDSFKFSQEDIIWEASPEDLKK